MTCWAKNPCVVQSSIPNFTEGFPVKKDNVNNPSHYNHKGIECIQAIEAALTEEEFRGYLKGNIIKYNWRERYKNGLEDLRKAQWYINKLVQLVEKLSAK